MQKNLSSVVPTFPDFAWQCTHKKRVQSRIILFKWRLLCWELQCLRQIPLWPMRQTRNPRAQFVPQEEQCNLPRSVPCSPLQWWCWISLGTDTYVCWWPRAGCRINLAFIFLGDTNCIPSSFFFPGLLIPATTESVPKTNLRTTRNI